MADSPTPPAGQDTIVFQPAASRPPPPATVGVIGWLRGNLFYNWFSTLITFALAYVLVATFLNIWEWSVTKAVWEAENRRECLDTSPDGACWAGVRAWFWAFVYGRYPSEEVWRVDLGFYLLIAWLAPLWFPNLKGKIGIGASAVVLYPFLAGYLFSGGERGWFMQTTMLLACSVLTLNYVHIALNYATGHSLREWVVKLSGFENRHEGQHKYPYLAVLLVTFGIFYAILGSWTVSSIDTTLWGGLFLTIVVAGIAIVCALPGGIILALARRSNMPIIKVFSITFIELFRSVPLISVLFMAVTMMPLFLPQDFQLNKLVQAIIGVCLFAAAYMAEVVRGGLQAIPKGQYEAAAAMGLTYWKTMNLIILPQALKIMIPNIVGNFMGLLKDTTLVSIIGLYDMLLMLRAAGQNPQWIGLHTETLVFGATIYFILCFAMSQYSQHLEVKLNTGHKR